MSSNVISLSPLGYFEDPAGILEAPPRLIEMLPLAIYACGADGRIRWFNTRATELWGRTPCLDDGEMFCGSDKIFDIDGRHVRHDQLPIVQVLKTGQRVDGDEIIIERPDGSRVAAMVHIDAIKDTDGQVIGAINCFHDVSELRRAQQALQEREQWFHNLLEALPAAIYTTDAEGRITFYNQAAIDFSGRRPQLGSDEWCVTWKLYQTDGTPLPHDECPMAVALKEDRAVRGAEAVAERPDGTRLSFAPYPTPLHDRAGKLVGAVNMLVDVTARKQSQKRLELLAREVDHRSKNMLAVIQAMVRFTRADTVPDFAGTILGRISALANAHTLLSESRWEGADLKRLAEEELAPYCAEDEARVRIDGHTLALVPTVAQSLAIVLHELTTNAVKHGALAKPEGQISITWSQDDDGGLDLRWIEKVLTGVVRPPRRHGFGMSVIKRTIEDQLEGHVCLEWTDTGLVCTLRVPAATLARR
jgi:PAS domain S-box-containing protein